MSTILHDDANTPLCKNKLKQFLSLGTLLPKILFYRIRNDTLSNIVFSEKKRNFDVQQKNNPQNFLDLILEFCSLYFQSNIMSLFRKYVVKSV